MAVIFRDKFWPKFQQEFSPKFQNFGSNPNKIFYKILVNLNILPIIFAVVLLSLLQYYNKNPVRNLVSISAILLLKYCYTFSYRIIQQEAIVYCFSTLFSGQNFSSIFPHIFSQKFQSSFVENFRQNISIALVWPKKQNYCKSLVDVWL